MKTSTLPFGDVYNIYWHDYHIYYSIYHSIIFICGDGNKIYNCKVENFNVNYNLFFTYLGLGDRYNTALPAKDEFYNISFDNIIVDNSATDYGQIQFNANMKNVTFTNFQNNTESALYVKKYSRYFSNPREIKLNLENVFVNGEPIK